MNGRPAEDPEQQAAQKGDHGDDLPRLGPRAGQEHEQNDERNGVAQQMSEIRMQERRRHDPDQPGKPARNHAIAVQTGNTRLTK